MDKDKKRKEEREAAWVWLLRRLKLEVGCPIAN